MLLILATVCVACIGCSKFEDETAGLSQQKSSPTTTVQDFDNPLIRNWDENFTTPFALTTNWTLYGNPQPTWVQAAYGKQGLLDNNGAAPNLNYAVSNIPIGAGGGYSIESEVMVQILNTKGSFACPGIAVSKVANPVLYNGEIATGVSMRILYLGENAIWFPAKSRGHTWFFMDYLNEDGLTTSSSYILADTYSNKWIRLKIAISPLRNVKFYCNDNLIWAPFPRINQSITNNNRIVLGYTSAGDAATRAGVAYHNWVKATYFMVPVHE